MKIEEKYINRFEELIVLGESISDKKQDGTDNERKEFLKEISEWITNCLSAIENVSSRISVYYEKFFFYYNQFESYTTSFITPMVGVVKAIKNDYENGYLFNTRALIEAEVFDDFLEQSEHLLTQGYFTAAAVIAGSVLEDGLRKLCVKNGIVLSAKPKLDTMNADLAKADVYNLLKQKQITALADLRNKSAHGQGGFTKEDVEEMIKDVRRFMADYFS